MLHIRYVTVHMTNNPSKLLTAHQTAEMLSLHVGTLKNWRSMRNHPLPYVQMGNRIRYRLKDIESFLSGKFPRAQEEVSIITQYDMERGYWVDVGYVKGKQVWTRKHKEEKT